MSYLDTGDRLCPTPHPTLAAEVMPSIRAYLTDHPPAPRLVEMNANPVTHAGSDRPDKKRSTLEEIRCRVGSPYGGRRRTALPGRSRPGGTEARSLGAIEVHLLRKWQCRCRIE